MHDTLHHAKNEFGDDKVNMAPAASASADESAEGVSVKIFIGFPVGAPACKSAELVPEGSEVETSSFDAKAEPSNCVFSDVEDICGSLESILASPVLKAVCASPAASNKASVRGLEREISIAAVGSADFGATNWNPAIVFDEGI